MAKADKKPKKKASFFTRAAFFVFFIFCGITVFRMSAQINDRKAEIAVAEKQIASFEAQIEALNDELDTPMDYNYIRKIAKSKLNYSMPDDVVFYNDLSN